MKKITFLISIFSFMMGMSQNLITNGDFSNGATGWILDGGGTVVNGEAFFATTNAGGNPWDTQLAQSGFAFSSGVTYTLTFKARAASNRNITVAIQNPGPWTNQVPNQVYALTSTMQTFTQTVIASSTSANVNLAFLLANQGGSTAAVYIDDVSLTAPQSNPTQLDLVLGFETSESGGVNGGPFGNGPAPVIETGIGGNNTQVLKITGNPAGEPWQGINLNLTSLVNLTASKTMTMDVFSASPITFLVKVTGGIGGPAVVAAAASHPGGSTWQTVSFTFNTSLDGQAPLANGTYSGFVIHTYWAPGAVGFFNPTVPTPERTFWVDNIRGPLGTPPVLPAPTVAAPTPPARPAADVISLFSDAYTNIPIDTWSASWDDSNIEDVTIQGNATKKILFSNFLGVILTTAVNATEMTHFHMDYWVQQPSLIGKVLNPKLSNHATGNGETNALLLTHLPTENGSWVSLDVPLSSFTPQATFDRQAIKEFLLTSNIDVVYVDNIYLHKNTVLSVNEFDVNNKVTIYPNPANSIINLNAKHNIEQVAIFNITGQQILVTQPNIAETSIDVSNFNSGIYLVKTLVNGVENTTKFVKN